jgi:proteasome lid subunit RPN8/RPN11
MSKQSIHFVSRSHCVEMSDNILRNLGSLYWLSCQRIDKNDSPREMLAALVGYYSSDMKTAIVDGIVAETEGEYASCSRDVELLSRELHDIWKDTNGERFFLGEWHSHPLQSNAPSALDLETAHETACDKKAQCPQFIMAISGSNGLGVTVVTKNTTIHLSQVSP